MFLYWVVTALCFLPQRWEYFHAALSFYKRVCFPVMELCNITRFHSYIHLFIHLLTHLLQNYYESFMYRARETYKEHRTWNQGIPMGLARWHHPFNGHVFEQTPENGDGQGSLVCCSPQVAKRWTRLSDWTTTNGLWNFFLSDQRKGLDVFSFQLKIKRELKSGTDPYLWSQKLLLHETPSLGKILQHDEHELPAPHPEPLKEPCN